MSKKNFLSFRKLAIVSIIFVFGLSNSSIAVEKEGVGVSMEKGYKQVLLDNDVKEFYDLIGRFGHHAVAVGDEVYTQPYVYISLHLVQMRSAGWKDMDYDQMPQFLALPLCLPMNRGNFVLSMQIAQLAWMSGSLKLLDLDMSG